MKKTSFDPWQEEVFQAAWLNHCTGSAGESRKLTGRLLAALQGAAGKGFVDEDLAQVLQEMSQLVVHRGISPTEMVRTLIALRQHSTKLLSGEATQSFLLLLDEAVLYAMDLSLRAREEIIQRQRLDLLELSTPVMKLWEGILVVPLIGTLDSKRAQQVMERLLTAIVANSARVAILDITGVPAVDTLVANYILQTAAAVKLLGAKLIITGISPAIAQTMVHLGVDLGTVVTRSVLADGVALALKGIEKQIIPMNDRSTL